MKTSISVVLFIFFSSLALASIALLANPVAAAPSCPHFMIQDGNDADLEPDHVPTTPYQSECRLHRDVIGLARTMEWPSRMTLDCQGHKITPSSVGTLGESASRSAPELAILMRAGQVKNCRIEGFDHGIFVAKNKEPEDGGEARIEGNLINARFVSVHAVESDHLEVLHNRLTWQTRGGVGVLVHINSDDVVISDNDVVGDFAPTVQGAVLMPGPTASSNPVFNSGHGSILILQNLGTHPTLFNALVNGRLFQFKDSESPTPDSTFTENSLVEENVISFRANNNTEDGIVLSNTIHSIIRGNVIGAEDGSSSVHSAIRSGGNSGPPPSGSPRLYPKTCLNKTERLCLSSFDCNIAGLDTGPTDNCPVLETKGVFWFPQDLAYEDNTIFGPFQTALATTGDVVIRGNSVHGELPAGVTENFGIILAGRFPIENSVVTRNKIEGVATALRLINAFGGQTPAFFGVKFSLNDITGYTKAVLTSNDYALESELSVEGKGNYWGLACPGFNLDLVKKENGAPQTTVADHASYDVSVADLSEEELPQVCE